MIHFQMGAVIQKSRRRDNSVEARLILARGELERLGAAFLSSDGATLSCRYRGEMRVDFTRAAEDDVEIRLHFAVDRIEVRR